MSVGAALLSLLPVALSPLSIALVLLVIAGQGGLRSGVAIALGWFTGATSVLLVGMLGFGAAQPERSDGLPAWAQLGIGVGALVLGLTAMLRARSRGSTKGPARMARLADVLTPVRSALVGFALVGPSPRQWLFLIPAAAAFAAADVPGGLLALPLLGGSVATLGVAAPIVGFALVQARRPDALQALHTWWGRAGDVVSGAAAAVVGVAFILAAAV